MILDKGICTVFRRLDVSLSGEKPRYQYARIYQSWYGELSFESRPLFQTKGRRELHTDARIRVHQNRGLAENDAVVLCAAHSLEELPADATVYSITRCWHGQDEDGPTPITDVTLEVTRI